MVKVKVQTVKVDGEFESSFRAAAAKDQTQMVRSYFKISQH